MFIGKIIYKIQAFREGGSTERAHTIPHHGTYSVAKHSWNVATMLAILHPNPSKDLILAGMWHDVHERWTGDIPGSIKWTFNNILKGEVEKFENTINSGLVIDNILDLPAEDLKWLKACDMLEFWLWSIDQQVLGNQNANEGRSNAEDWFSNHKDNIPDEIVDFISHYKWRRTSDRDGWLL